SLIKQRYPDDEPLDKTLDWTLELAQTRVVGSNLPNALGIEGFDDIDLLVLENLLNGKTADDIRAELGSTGNERFNDLDARIERVRNAVIFRPLFL
ncbi:MAG TPA: hypothetical protein VGQ55_09120, partial [Pyrinomonadaceae bacterium]|nr:hypothetical protein [Pyrinomonadaceae bacterium]